jgi:hypothetical protein
MTFPVVGTLLGLGMANAATNGGVARLVQGDFRGFGAGLASAVANPGPAISNALPWGLGLTGYSLAKRAIRPGVNIGPLRIAA